MSQKSQIESRRLKVESQKSKILTCDLRPSTCDLRPATSSGLRPATCDFQLSTHRKAFTLIELLITIVLVGIVLLALIMGFQESLKNMERQKDLLSANLLGEELMNEIRSRQYVVTNDAGTNFRVYFNDVNDYNNLTDAPPKTIEGVILSNYSGFTRRVFVVNVSNVSDWATPTINTTDFKRITVVVSNAQLSVSNVSVVSRYD